MLTKCWFCFRFVRFRAYETFASVLFTIAPLIRNCDYYMFPICKRGTKIKGQVKTCYTMILVFVAIVSRALLALQYQLIDFLLYILYCWCDCCCYRPNVRYIPNKLMADIWNQFATPCSQYLALSVWFLISFTLFACLSVSVFSVPLFE